MFFQKYGQSPRGQRTVTDRRYSADRIRSICCAWASRVAIRPDNKIGARDFLFNRPLRGNALFDLLRRPAAGEQALPLILRRTRDTNNFVEVRFSPGFKQQRNHNDSQRAVFPAPGFDLGEPAFLNARVQNGFEFFAGGGIGKDNPREFVTAQFAIRGDNVFAENRLDFRQGGLAGLNELARQFIRIHDLRAAFAKKLGSGGFAHSQATGQTADFHRLTTEVSRYGHNTAR